MTTPDGCGAGFSHGRGQERPGPPLSREESVDGPPPAPEAGVPAPDEQQLPAAPPFPGPRFLCCVLRTNRLRPARLARRLWGQLRGRVPAACTPAEPGGGTPGGRRRGGEWSRRRARPGGGEGGAAGPGRLPPSPLPPRTRRAGFRGLLRTSAHVCARFAQPPLRLWGSAGRRGSCRAGTGCEQGPVPSRRLRGRFIFAPFPAFTSCPHSSAPGPSRRSGCSGRLFLFAAVLFSVVEVGPFLC